MITKRIPNGFEFPVLSIGTHSMGGEDNGPPDYSNDEKYIRAIKSAIKLGYNHIDTAEIYGGGHTEELVGKAIRDFSRSSIFITTKVSKNHLRFNDVISSAKSSLKRLGTNYIDLYLIHSPNLEVPIRETMSAMSLLKEKGLVRNIGVSAFSAQEIKEAQKHSKHPIVAAQLKLSLWNKADIEAIRYCQDNNIILIAYKPFGRGMVKKHKILLIESLSKKYRKTNAQIILKWIISKKNTVALFKSTSTAHLKENKDIFDFELTEKEIAGIDSLLISLN